MAFEEVNKGKCFTFIWKIEISNWRVLRSFQSPAFTVDEINATKWNLNLDLSFGIAHVDFHLLRLEDDNGAGNVQIDCELALLSPDGTVLQSFERKKSVKEFERLIGANKFPSWGEVFNASTSEFSPQNTLTVRCRIWRSVGELSNDVQCFARTRIAVEKRSYLWNIGNFSDLKSDVQEQTCKIKSLETGEELMRLELSLTEERIYGDRILLKTFPNFKIIRFCTLQLSIVDASKNTVKCFREEFWFDDPSDSREFTLFYTKGDLVEMKKQYLPNDVLSLLCECSFCCGTLVEEIRDTRSTLSTSLSAIENVEQVYRCSDKADELPLPKDILINNFKSMLNSSVLSDVKLKARSKTYPAHTFVLGVRSPVFRTMFSNDMKGKMNDCVDMDDFSDETVLNLLRYIYSADVEALEWDRATELYEAADKYEILNLRDICASGLKTNLCPRNASKALVLADLHHDEDLKAFVQDFILIHGKDIINSEEWDQLMDTNLKLASETMHRKYKE